VKNEKLEMTKSSTRIAVIGTGGSISAIGRHSLDLFEYIDFGRIIEVDELLEMFPEASSEFTVVPVRFQAIDSKAMTPNDWLELNRKISAVVKADPSISGIVVTHGTAVLEETAYFLHLAAKIDIPIVLVGAQRSPSGLSTDAGINLVNAIRVAACPAARGLGTLTVLNDEIHCARDVTKSSNYRLHAFRTSDLGMLGYADPDGAVTIYRQPTRRHGPNTEFDTLRLENLPRVEIIYSYTGADGFIIDSLVRSGTKGIVVAGLPPGRPTASQRSALLAASRDGVLIIQSSRAASGRVIASTQDVRDGFIAADTLNPQKARVLSMLALTVTTDRHVIQQMFADY
jgi:L-asparaginase